MMTKTQPMRYLLFALITLAFTGLGAGSARGDRISELQDRFRQRDADVRAAKRAGTIGETHLGFVEAVPKAQIDSATRRLMDDENADRRELYALIAEKEGTTPEKVAQRNAVRNFQRAAPGEMLKHADGWRKKT